MAYGLGSYQGRCGADVPSSVTMQVDNKLAKKTLIKIHGF